MKKKQRPKFRNKLGLLHTSVFLAILIFDQITKLAFLTYPGKDFGWIAFHLVKNTGASFGMLKAFGFFLALLSIMALVVIAWYYVRSNSRVQLFLTIIGAGVLGNLLNRITYGYVIDFVDLKWWPVFNVADSAIVVGVIGLAIYMTLKK
ncbi:MAG: signal peptidase II [Nanoarchaeota archaeon]|nr:signal peptidase II [Nanoarchaeota archaeon]